MAEHNRLGIEGEKAASFFLIKEGYTILEINWRFQKMEIDIIAMKDGFVIFIEVKTRKTDKWGNPEDAVSKRKIKNIVEAADYYVKENDINLPVRFDVISVIWNGKNFEIKHFDDAFLSPLYNGL